MTGWIGMVGGILGKLFGGLGSDWLQRRTGMGRADVPVLDHAVAGADQPRSTGSSTRRACGSGSACSSGSSSSALLRADVFDGAGTGAAADPRDRRRVLHPDVESVGARFRHHGRRYRDRRSGGAPVSRSRIPGRWSRSRCCRCWHPAVLRCRSAIQVGPRPALRGRRARVMDNVEPLLIELPEQLLTPRLSLSPPEAGRRRERSIAPSSSRLRSCTSGCRGPPRCRRRSSRNDLCARLPSATSVAKICRCSCGCATPVSSSVRRECTASIGPCRVSKSAIGAARRASGAATSLEAVTAITRFAFETLQAARVEIRTDVANSRSFKIAERLGFTLEGILRRDSRTPRGELRDTRLYAMTDIAELTPRATRAHDGTAAAAPLH